MSQRDNLRLVDFLLDNVDCPSGQEENDNLVGLMVGDVGMPLKFGIYGFLGAATVPTTSERSDSAFFFFFEFEVEDLMVDDTRVGIVLKAGGSTGS